MSEPGRADPPPESRSTAHGPRLGALLRSGRDRAAELRTTERLLALVTIAALAGGALLIVAEFLDLFEIEAAGLVVKQQAGGPHHSYAMLVVGVGTIVATLLARSTEQWPPALGVVALAGFALAFTLIADLPDVTRSDLVRGARIAEAHPAIGFWTQLAGATIAFVSGLVLLRLLRRAARELRS
jgi:hypothetical protein